MNKYKNDGNTVLNKNKCKLNNANFSAYTVWYLFIIKYFVTCDLFRIPDYRKFDIRGENRKMSDIKIKKMYKI